MDATVKADKSEMVVRLANGATVTANLRGVEAWIPGGECVFRHKHDIATQNSVVYAMQAAMSYEPCTCDTYEVGSGAPVPETCPTCRAPREDGAANG